ncbi:MAG TPA: AI-2E family transporter [Treponemataceae bacterium]|nr:AI-2E family transporter [Treponemataceae bacterium]
MLKKTNLNTIFLFALFALFFVALVGIFYPFFYVILWASLLYILLNPLYKKIQQKITQKKRFLEIKRHALAAIFSIATLILIIGPLLLLTIQLAQQLLAVFKDIELFLRTNPTFFSDSSFIKKTIDILNDFGIENELFSQVDGLHIRAFILQTIQYYSNTLLKISKNLLENTANFILSILFVVFALYFFYLDGAYLFTLLIKAIPINPKHMDTLAKKFSETIRGLLSGYFLVALYQGIIAFILMKIFGIKAALLFSVLLMFSSFIPLFGAGLIWFPLGIILLFTDSVIKGILFLVLSAFFISFLDNFLRPFFLQDRIKVHPLLIFFAILGGLKIFGLNGLILGPTVIILFFAVLDMLVSFDEENFVEENHNPREKNTIEPIE